MNTVNKIAMSWYANASGEETRWEGATAALVIEQKG